MCEKKLHWRCNLSVWVIYSSGHDRIVSCTFSNLWRSFKRHQAQGEMSGKKTFSLLGSNLVVSKSCVLRLSAGWPWQLNSRQGRTANLRSFFYFYSLSHCFRMFSLNNTAHRLTLIKITEMVFEESFSLSREENISQRRPEYTEDDISRRFFGSFTFPIIAYLFGLKSEKAR